MLIHKVMQRALRTLQVGQFKGKLFCISFRRGWGGSEEDKMQNRSETTEQATERQRTVKVTADMSFPKSKSHYGAYSAATLWYVATNLNLYSQVWLKVRQQTFTLWLRTPHGKMSIPKVSTVHQGFAGTFIHMDGNDGEEKERKKHLWSLERK